VLVVTDVVALEFAIVAVGVAFSNDDDAVLVAALVVAYWVAILVGVLVSHSCDRVRGCCRGHIRGCPSRLLAVDVAERGGRRLGTPACAHSPVSALVSWQGMAYSLWHYNSLVVGIGQLVFAVFEVWW